MNNLEAARGELRQAAVDYIGLMEVDHDDDAYVNAIARLEVAAEKFTDEKRAAVNRTKAFLNEGIAETFIEMLKTRRFLAEQKSQQAMQEMAAINAAIQEAEKYQ